MTTSASASDLDLPSKLPFDQLTTILQAPAPAMIARPPFNGVMALAQRQQLHYWFGAPGVTVQSRFVIGSLSKQLTAGLVMKAIAQQKLTWDSLLSDSVPQQPQQPKVTVGQLLQQTSGLIANDQAPLFAPGSQFRYSNANYELLADVLEAVNQQSYAEQMATLFRQCQLWQAFVPTATLPTSAMPNLVQGYQEDEQGIHAGALDAPLRANASGHLVASAGDLIRWQHCLYQSAWLDSTVKTQMLTPGLVRPHRWGAVRYAAGIQVLEQDGLLEYSHSGYVPGYISTLLYYPQYELSLVLLEPLSLKPDTMERVFYYHDRTRLWLRQQLLRQETP